MRLYVIKECNKQEELINNLSVVSASVLVSSQKITKLIVKWYVWQQQAM